MVHDLTSNPYIFLIQSRLCFLAGNIMDWPCDRCMRLCLRLAFYQEQLSTVHAFFLSWKPPSSQV
jgi:hypothetical protein